MYALNFSLKIKKFVKLSQSSKSKLKNNAFWSTYVCISKGFEQNFCDKHYVKLGKRENQNKHT